MAQTRDRFGPKGRARRIVSRGHHYPVSSNDLVENSTLMKSLQLDGSYWLREEFRKLFHPHTPHPFLTSFKKFIEAVTGIRGTVNHGLTPAITGVTVTKIYFPEFIDSDIHFVDTPGFGGWEPDADIFGMISERLLRMCAINISAIRERYLQSNRYKNELRVAGLLYFHRISDDRMAQSAMENLISSQKLFEGEFDRIVFTTTMWDLVDEEMGVKRERQLMDVSRFICQALSSHTDLCF